MLSPACASLDMYSSYVQRGNAFIEALAHFGIKAGEGVAQ